MRRPTYAQLSTQALWDNIQFVRSKTPGSKLMLMVKANAYGHGLRSVSLRSEGWVDGLGVASMDEAVILRECGITIPIHVMQGIFRPDDISLCYEHSLVPVIYRHDQLEMLHDFSKKYERPGASLGLWIKIQTGMNRLGFSLKDVDALLSWVSDHDAYYTCGAMTHWSCASDVHHPEYIKQYQIIKSLIDAYPQVNFSVNNSSGMINAPEFNGQWVRIGASIYGIGMAYRDLKSVMSFKSQVIQRRQCKVGESVGYDAAYYASDPTEMAVITAGYGDGYPRVFKPGMSVLIRGHACPIIGSVSMDMLTVDVSRAPEIKVGDEVTLWGEDLKVDDVAASAGMIPYQLVTAVHNRVRFTWDDDLVVS